ncbi:MAG: glycoside hydrolase family 52 protein [Opitutales bacterium]
MTHLKEPNFNAHHSPLGAFATFTLGQFGRKGGLGLELGGPARENVYIGLESRSGGTIETLPFFEGSDDEAKRYDVDADPSQTGSKGPSVKPFATGEVRRSFGLATDTWEAGDLKFSILSPAKQAPEPGRAKVADLKAAYVPAVFAELTLDNTKGKKARRFCFGYQGSDRYSCMRRLDDVSRGKFTGVGQGLRTAIVSKSPGVRSALSFSVGECLEPTVEANHAFGLGGVGLLFGAVPAGKKKTVRFAVCFHRGGVVTSGMPTSYLYDRYFKDIESVAQYALDTWADQARLARASERLIEGKKLSPERHFMLCHAVRSYYGSTQLLDQKGTHFWVVNEGEYRMMNTFDLTVDHLFFELAQNPWVVRDQLDWFIKRYSYTDKVRLQGDATEYPGGISFTHDMGVGNVISRPSFSAYELQGLDGCFSHMTHEQLTNWLLCALSYVEKTGDTRWMKAQAKIFNRCLQSLLNRDHPKAGERDGVMDADSSRCQGGAEITTYDSLDPSLGQARNNVYLAVKTWAAYVGLEKCFGTLKDPRRARTAATQAQRCAATIISEVQADGSIPAILKEGSEARIIPAIEGLAFPGYLGCPEAARRDGPYADLISALETHFDAVLRVGTCRFEDGGWKLSSTNDNSWLSKIYLCQHVAETVFGRPVDEQADQAHMGWLLRPDNAFFAWSDQMVAGVARASKYYPRGVTGWLWGKS